MSEAVKTIEERFTAALAELIGICIEAGMHPVDMIEPMETELRWIKETIARIDREGR